MTTKSRYETISDLEQQRRNLLQQKDAVDNQIREKEKRIKLILRQAEDETEELEQMREDRTRKLETLEAQIDSVNQALDRIQASNS